jgi:hypothetical protein
MIRQKIINERYFINKRALKIIGFSADFLSFHAQHASDATRLGQRFSTPKSVVKSIKKGKRCQKKHRFRVNTRDMTARL